MSVIKKSTLSNGFLKVPDSVALALTSELGSKWSEPHKVDTEGAMD